MYLQKELPNHIAKLSTGAVKELQLLLNKTGANLVIDGIVGNLTISAFNDFKTKYNLTHPNEIGQTTYNLLIAKANQLIITSSQLKSIYPQTTIVRINQFLPAINDCLTQFNIIKRPRITAFLAQIGHESGGLRWVEELANGRAYEGRKDLGNIYRGDGVRFKGRGLIQITGRYNYTKVANYFKVDCVNNPKILAQLPYSVLTAGWYWHTRKLNSIADLNTLDSFKRITKSINGGYNGLQDRINYWNRAKSVIK